MKRVLLDTNVYGELILDEGAVKALLSLIPVELIVYGSEVNRKELRDVSEGAKAEDWEGKIRSKRMMLLKLYDLVTQKDERTYRTSQVIELLSVQYFDEYLRVGGKIGYEELRKDFIIVATASVHGLDIVVSKDAKTMFSDETREAYGAVNRKNQLQMPSLLDYEEFKRLLARLEQGRLR